MSALHKYYFNAFNSMAADKVISLLANFNVIFYAAININNYKSHQMRIQIQSMDLMLSFQEMHYWQEIYFIVIQSFQWDYYL